MACCGRCKNVDWDTTFAYDSVRTVRIRDRRLGLTMCSIQVAVFIYVVVYQLVLRQAYMVAAPISGSVRVQLKRPSPAYQWPDSQAPYCAGSANTAGGQYVYPAAGMYQYVGQHGILAPQGACRYYDENFITLNPLESAAAYLPTRITVSNQVVSPLPDCADLSHSYCQFNVTSSNLTYVADTEMFTILVDHSFTSTAGISRSSVEMSGEMLTGSGKLLNPCDAYAGYPGGCPDYIGVGVGGARDIFSIRTLLHAAGIQTLDQVAGTEFSLDNQTLRYAGIVITINIVYENFMLPLGKFSPGTGSMDNGFVKYYYIVTVVPNVEYKAEDTVTSDNQIPSVSRTVYNTHGVRIVVTQSGRIGYADFQQFLINVVVSLGLLSVATMLTDFAMLNVCPLRHLYAQYKTRKTVDMGDFSGKLSPDIVHRIKSNPDLVDPPSAALLELFDTQRLAKGLSVRERVDKHVALAALAASPAASVSANPLNGASAASTSHFRSPAAGRVEDPSGVQTWGGT